MAQNGTMKEIFPPDWMDDKFFQDALRNGLKKKDLILTECVVLPATAVGDNYASQMFRIRSKLKEGEKSEIKEFSFIVKTFPLGKFAEKMHLGEFFDKESRMFTKTLPKTHELLVKAYPGHERLFAQCYHAQGAPNNAIVLEDLRKIDFTLGDRFGGVDLDHSLLVVRQLAKQHAASHIILQTDPEEAKFYDESLWTPRFEETIKNMMGNAVTYIANYVRDWKDLPGHDRYYEKLIQLQENIMQVVFDSYVRDDEEVNVILHGDCWTNNMMFRYDENHKVNAVKFCDLQLSCHNTPALDLNYYIFSSSKCRFTHLDVLLEAYYESFTETLKRLNYELKKPFSLEILKKNFHKRIAHGLITTLCVLPITSAPPEEAPDIDDLAGLSGEQAKSSLYTHKLFVKVLREALPFFEAKGLL